MRVKYKGVNPLPAYGREGQGQHFLLAAHFAKRNTKNCGGGKARAGREFIFPTPLFLLAPPERKSFLLCRAKRGNQNSQSGFSSKKVRILSKRYRRFTILEFCVRFTSLSLRSGSAFTTILYGFLKSKNNFCPLKRKFGLPKANINLKNLLTNLFSFVRQLADERQSDNLILTAQII